MPLRAGVLVGDDAGAARGGEPLLGPAGLVLLRGGVLVGVSAGVGAGVGGPGEAPGAPARPGRLPPCNERRRLGI